MTGFINGSGDTSKSTHDDLGERGKRKQLVIGLDFGTAFTKVVVGEARTKYAIPWVNPVTDTSDYLLPGVLYINNSGECALSPYSTNGEAISDLKLRLLSGDRSVASLSYITAYIALVLRHTITFIMSEHKTVYGNFTIDWMVNVGLPTDDYHNVELVSLYQKIISNARQISAMPSSVHLHACRNLVENEPVENTENNDLDRITAVPEFVAQITGYVKSPLRNPDLHLLVDVGAGTVDVTLFNVHEHDGEDAFPIFGKSVELLGTRYLVKNRLKLSPYLQETGELGPFSQIPNEANFAKLLGVSEPQLKQQDSGFKSKFKKQITRLLQYTRSQRYPQSVTWSQGIPTFFCGGGSRCDFYRDGINEILNSYKLDIRSLTSLTNLEAKGIRKMDYDRFSVAHGLSYDRDDLGEVTRSDEIEDVVDTKTSKSGLCPVCNGFGNNLSFRSCQKCGGSGFL